MNFHLINLPLQIIYGQIVNIMIIFVKQDVLGSILPQIISKLNFNKLFSFINILIIVIQLM